MTPDYLASDHLLPEPDPIHLRYDTLTPQGEYGLHRHRWGQLNGISLGLVELDFGQRQLVAPADYLTWIPADVPHAAQVDRALAYTSVYVGAALAARLPGHPCLIPQSAVVRALLDDFRQRGVGAVRSDWDRSQAELMVEHLVRAGHEDSYLPDSRHRLLHPILQAVRQNPADATPLAHWAGRVHATERTLARHFQRELGMSFVQWRNRVRLLYALARLKEGMAVQDIADALGYATPSAFIAMFNKQVGMSPERYRRQLVG